MVVYKYTIHKCSVGILLPVSVLRFTHRHVLVKNQKSTTILMFSLRSSSKMRLYRLIAPNNQIQTTKTGIMKVTIPEFVWFKKQYIFSWFLLTFILKLYIYIYIGTYYKTSSNDDCHAAGFYLYLLF